MTLPVARVIPIRLIKVASDRARKNFGDMDELVGSIKTNGLMHPPVVVAKDDHYLLIAGERRLRACIMLGWSELPVRDSRDLKPGEECDELRGAVLELEENVVRKDIDWPEKISNLKKIDEIRRSIQGSAVRGHSSDADGKWKTEDLKELTGESRTAVMRQVAFAKDMDRRPDIADKVKHLPMNVALKQFKQIEETEKVQKLVARGKVELIDDLRLGRAEALIKELPDASVDLILTDPPFGIGKLMDLTGDSENSTSSYKSLTKSNDDGDREYVKSLISILAPELARVLKPSGHIYMFFCNEMYDVLMTILSRHFIMHPVPIVWDKGRTTGPFMGYSYATSYEPILFGHKEPRAKRLTDSCRDILLFPAVQSKDKIHVFQKPQELLRYLIKQSTNIGDKILDPCAGSGATLVAAKSMGRSAIGFELDKDHYTHAQQWLLETRNKAQGGT